MKSQSEESKDNNNMSGTIPPSELGFKNLFFTDGNLRDIPKCSDS